MSDAKVSELVTATSVGGSDLFYLVQTNTSKKITAANLFGNISNPTLSGNIIIGGTPQTLGSPGIVNITTPITHLSADAIGGTLQIPAGTQGQFKLLTMTATAGGSYTVATSNIAGNTSIVFDAVGDTVLLYFTNSKWAPVASSAALDLTSISSNVIPSVNSVFDLGSPTNQWKSLYVSNNTIFIGGTPLTVLNEELVIGSGEESANLATVAYVNGAVANAGGGGVNTGNISFANSTISALNLNEIIVQAKDTDGFPTARLSLEPEFSTAQLSAYSSESTDTFTLANGDFATGVWQDNGFGNGEVSFTGAQNIGDFFENTLLGLTPENVSIIINSEPAFIWNGGTSGSGTDTPGFGTNPIVPQSPIAITSIQFVYRSQSFIRVNYDNQEIRLKAQNAGIEMDATSAIQVFSNQSIELQSESDFTISSGQDINISTSSDDRISISTGDFIVSADDDISITGRDSFRFRNRSNTAPIRIITDDDDNSYAWVFGANGTLSTPGNIIVNGNVTPSANVVFDLGSLTNPWKNLYVGGGLLGNVYGDSNELTLKSPTGGGGVGYVALASPNEQNYVEVNNDEIVLGVKFGTAEFQKVTFDIDGDLTIPGSIVSNSSITVASEVGGTSSGVFLAGASDVVLFATSNAIIRSDNNGTSKDWTFSADGNLTAPGIISANTINATNSFGLPVYATDAARDIAIPSPQTGMMVYVSGGEGAGLQVRGATQWNPVGGLTGV